VLARSTARPAADEPLDVDTYTADSAEREIAG